MSLSELATYNLYDIKFHTTNYWTTIIYLFIIIMTVGRLWQFSKPSYIITITRSILYWLNIEISQHLTFALPIKLNLIQC